MSLVVDEKELIKELKEQGVLKDVASGFFEYKLFGVIPVEFLLSLAISILILKNKGKK